MPQTRQLAAIMFTDIVGYTSLMGADERKAFDILRKNRQLQKRIIADFSGSWIKELGDGVLASFNTATNAVACAKNIQAACDDIADFKLRIGIHLGEVVFEDNDVFGDGVNIAARLQALAPIGGIYMSETVFRNIENKEGMDTEFLKEVNLKNVKHPVKVYELRTNGKHGEESHHEAEFEKVGAVSEKSIAVLPFVNMSNDVEQEYFSDGISEEIINSLVQVPELKVTGRTSAFSFKGKNEDLRLIGEKLGVSKILEGSVRRSGSRIRITAQLIEASNGFHLWSQKFDREFSDIFAVQDEISQAIAEQLRLKLVKPEAVSVKSSVPDMESYNLFLKGRFYWSKRTREGLKKSIEYFEAAIEKDPGYAPAYAAMSDSYSLLCAYHILAPEDSILKARSIAKKAAEIDPFLAEAYEAMGHVEFLYDWNWKKATEYYEKAIKLNSHYATALQRHALLLTLFNKVPQALEQIMQAVNNDPLSLVINTDVALIYFIQKNYQLAIEKCTTVLDIDPNFILALFVTGLAHEQLNDHDAAITYFQRACDVYGENTIVRGALIHALGIAGRKAEAEKLFEELMNLPGSLYISPYTIATAYLALSKTDDALEWLEKAVDTRSVWLIHLHMKFDPRLNVIRHHERFRALLEKMSLHD